MVAFGSVVEVEISGRTNTYTIVAAPESAPAEGKLSIDSPMGKALVGARVGQTVTYPTPRGDKELKILSIGG
jgi:transcription elongation GreA/GreB family factor